MADHGAARLCWSAILPLFRCARSGAQEVEEKMSLWKILGFGPAPGGERPPDSSDAAEGAETETVRKIAAQLRKLDPAHARHTAAFAYILSRVANADSDISDQETRRMESIVREIGGFGGSQASLVVEMAKTHATLFGGTEDFLVTREFEKTATREEKLSLLSCLFAVAAADETISSEEESVIRQTASELRLSHSDFITARLKYKEFLAVFKELNR